MGGRRRICVVTSHARHRRRMVQSSEDYWTKVMQDAKFKVQGPKRILHFEF